MKYDMKYGDYSNVTQDVAALTDILNRQGSYLLLEVMAENVGKAVLNFKLSQKEVDVVVSKDCDTYRALVNERT